MRVRFAIWVTALTLAVAYAALHVAVHFIRAESQVVDDQQALLIGKRTSLDDTFAWIQKWIGGVEVRYTARYHNPDVVLRVADRYKAISQADCAVTLVVSDATNDTPDHEVSFDLRDLEHGIRVVKMTYDGVEFWKVPLQTTGFRQAINDRSGATSYTYITAVDQITARRIAIAFNHAISLCSTAKKTGAPPPNEAALKVQ